MASKEKNREKETFLDKTLNMAKNPFDPFALPNSRKRANRDSKRSFNRTQKNEILYQQNNKCARCKKSLDPRTTDFDHKKPWADKGRTCVENGRALHKDCHGIITHQTRLKKVDKRRKSSSPKNPFKINLKTTKNPFGF